MDMSSLHNHLPPSGTAAAHKRQHSPQPPTALTDDFKSAALAVTRLYQNSARQIDNARQEGYLSAVQEVAQLLSSGELAGDRLREWCAVGLSRITARQDEENRTRPHQQQQQQQEQQQQQDERQRQEEERRREEQQRQETSINQAGTNGMPFSPAMPNIFGDTEFTFQSPSPGVMMSGYASPFTTGARFEPEVTYELVDAAREGRKRGVSTQQQQGGSIWDVTGMGSKRSRHI
jgi:hypothetical protein